MDPIRSGRTPFDLIPDRVVINWSISTMQASSSQHFAANEFGLSRGEGEVESGKD